MQKYHGIPRSLGLVLLFAGLIPLLVIRSVGATAAETCAGVASDPRYSQIETMMAAEFAKGSGTALTLGIVEHGCLVWVSNFGKMDQNRTAPPTERSMYPIASITKLFTGIMLLQMVERGKVHLTDPSGIIVLTSHRTNEYKPLVRKGLAILNPNSTGGTGLKSNEEH